MKKVSNFSPMNDDRLYKIKKAVDYELQDSNTD